MPTQKKGTGSPLRTTTVWYIFVYFFLRLMIWESTFKSLSKQWRMPWRNYDGWNDPGSCVGWSGKAIIIILVWFFLLFFFSLTHQSAPFLLFSRFVNDSSAISTHSKVPGFGETRPVPASRTQSNEVRSTAKDSRNNVWHRSPPRFSRRSHPSWHAWIEKSKERRKQTNKQHER